MDRTNSAKVRFFGQLMSSDWAQMLEQSQKLVVYAVQGTNYPRVPYGSETFRTPTEAPSKPCRHCRTIFGKLHEPRCDYEQCPRCRGQCMSCDCEFDDGGNLSKPEPPAKTSKPVRPLSPKQLRIAAARKQFKWRHTGFAENGDAVFEVRNESEMTLPYLSIGVRSKNLLGGAWLNVAHIKPGCTELVQKGCYKELLLPAELEFFEKDEPTAETLDRYWEFK
jgi:hypothetical protein